MQYRFASRWHVASPVPAAVVAAELQRLYELEKRLTPDAVIAAARPATAPLHEVFEWDDRVAADEYRHIQARSLIRAITVVHDTTPEQPQRLYVHVSDEAAYQPISVVVRQADLFAQARERLAARLTEATNSLAELERAAAEHAAHTPARRAGLRRVAAHVEEARKELATVE